jgi:hypothetical protein
MKKGMKRKRTGKQFMNDADFAQLQDSLNEALEHARGERADLRVTRVPLTGTAKADFSVSRCSHPAPHALLSINVCEASQCEFSNCSGLGARPKDPE